MKTWVIQKRIELIALGAVVVVAAVIALISLASSGARPATAAASVTPSVTVSTSTDQGIAYELEGTATGADITIQTPSGSSQQQGVSVPLRNNAGSFGLRFTGFRPGAFLYISAQNTGYGKLTCRIRDLRTNTVIAENSSSGEYAITTCSGRA